MVDDKDSDAVAVPENVREVLANCSVRAAYEGAAFALPRDEVPEMITWESLAHVLSESRQLDDGFVARVLSPVQSVTPLELNAAAYNTLPGVFSMLAGVEASGTTISELRQLLNDNPQIDTCEALRAHLAALGTIDGLG